MKCADCGAEVEPVPRTVGTDEARWGRRTDPRPPARGWGWDMCCRVIYDPDDHARILTADYHYVDGEEQRHFRAP